MTEKDSAKYSARVRCSLRNSEKKSTLGYCVLSSLFCSLTVLGAYLKIPFPIPVTLQLLFTNTAALLLGARWGCLSSVLYLALGIAGLPVFSSGGGIASFVSPTFGFALGFIPGAFLSGVINEKSSGMKSAVIASAANIACVYLCGTVYYLLICNLYFSEATTLSYALSVCVLPFILPDIAKCAVSVLLYKKLNKHIKANKHSR